MFLTPAKANDTADPISTADAATKTKQASTLNFSTGTSKRRANETESGKSWDEVVKRSKVDPSTVEDAKKLKEDQEAEDKKGKDKGEKAKKKKKKDEAKKVSMLSFDDE